MFSSCNSTLGLESGLVKDHDLSASSSFDDHSTGPQNARLNKDRHGGAWCPKQAVSEAVKEWLQVDLRSRFIITAIVTQGRYGRGKGQEFVQRFRLEYRRSAKLTQDWQLYTDANGNQVFDANFDTSTSVLTSLSPPIVAHAVRVVPFSLHPRVVCLRFELHGCQENSGIVGYSSPPPDLPGTANVSLGNADQWWSSQDRDVLYDGQLGQDVTHLHDVPTYSQGWMGWKRRGSKPVELLFEFDGAKNFSKVTFFVANRIDLSIQVFKRATLWFGSRADRFSSSPSPVVFEYMPDTAVTESRAVSVKIPFRVGRFVKIQLAFENVWILVSEISFEATKARETAVLEEDEDEAEDEGEDSDDVADGDKVAKAEVTRPATSTPTSTSSNPMTTSFATGHIEQVERSSGSLHLEVVIGILTAVTLLLLFLFVAVLMYSRRQKLLGSPASRSMHAFPAHINMKEMLMNLTPPGPPSSASPPPPAPPTSTSATPLAANIIANPNYEAAATAFYDAYRMPPPVETQILEESRSKWFSTGHMFPGGSSALSRPVTEYASVAIKDINLPAINSTMHNYRSLQQQQQQPVLVAAGRAVLRNSLQQQQHQQQQHHHQQQQQQAVYNLGNYFPRISSEPPTRKRYSSSNSSNSSKDVDGKMSPVLSAHWNLCAASGSLSSGCPSTSTSTALQEIPRAQLRVKSSLGPGCKGEVVLCEIDSAYSNVPLSVCVRSSSSSSVDREDFLRECRVLASLQHHNVARLVGVSVSEEPYCAVIENTDLGHLCHFLRNPPEVLSSSPSSSPLASARTALSSQRLVDFAAQIASGMKYLESHGVIHRDLAARNCLLTEGLVVKLSDVAMGMAEFAGDYSDVAGRRHAPIRWQPWETILAGRLSWCSNVWSFGVTAWEVLSLCREQPWTGLSDVATLRNAEALYYEGKQQVSLPKPDLCDSDVWDLLEECWSRDEQARPTFAEIYLFLKRKTLAFEVQV